MSTEFFDSFAQNAHPGTDYNCLNLNIHNQFYESFINKQKSFCKGFPDFSNALLGRKELFIKQYNESLFDLI